MKIGSAESRGFTLVEMLVVVGVIAILAGLLMPSLSRAKQKASRIKCLSDIRQLSLSATLYATDHDGQFPPRRRAPNTWVTTLKPYYVDVKILKCPNDPFKSDRSYIINGWNDYFQAHLAPEEYKRYTNWSWPAGMRENAVPEPSQTIIFGEKKPGSKHVHMDFGQGLGNDRQEIAQNMHRSGDDKNSGGSNYAFVDGSSRFLPFGGSLKPLNLWALTDVWRQAPIQLQ